MILFLNTFFDGLKFRWDFETDGIWDTNFENQPIAVYCFNSPGIIIITLEVKDSDGNSAKAVVQVEVKSANQLVDTMIDPRDQQQYRIVKITNDWWMAENLDYGKYIPGNIEQLDNQIAEKYYLFDDSVGYKYLGGIYRWEEVLNYPGGKVQGLCPPGWHIPSFFIGEIHGEASD